MNTETNPTPVANPVPVETVTATPEPPAPEGKTYPSDEAIAKVMSDRGISRIAAVQYIIRHQSKKVATVEPTKTTKKAKRTNEQKEPKKAAAKTTKPKTEKKAGKYNRDKVIDLWVEGGKTVTEIAAMKTPGIAGISKVYVYRLLFGSDSKNSGGVSKEQQARRKEQAARVKAWAAERDAK